MTIAIVYAAAFFAGFVVESRIDGSRIISNQRINHSLSIAIWAVIFSLLSIAASAAGSYWNFTAWNTTKEVLWSITVLALPMATCMALFSTGFRMGMNEIRAINRYYIAPGSLYDYVAISLIQGEFEERSVMNKLHWKRYTTDKAYENNIHRAGSLLYIVEAIAYVPGIAITTYFSING